MVKHPAAFPATHPSEEEPMPAGNRGPRSCRALVALAAVGCAALLGAGSPAAQAGGATTTLSTDVVHNLSLATLIGSVPAS